MLVIGDENLFTPEQRATLRDAWRADGHFWFLVQIYADDVQLRHLQGEVAADGLRWLVTVRQRPNLNPAQGGQFYWFIPDREETTWGWVASPRDVYRNWLPPDFHVLHYEHGELCERLAAAVDLWVALPDSRRRQLWDAARAAVARRAEG